MQIRADKHWFLRREVEKNPHGNLLPQTNKQVESSYDYEKNSRRSKKGTERMSSFQDNGRMSLRGSHFSDHHSFNEKIFETCPTLASEVSPRNSVFYNNKDLNRLKSLVAGSEIFPVLTEENNLGEMQTEDESEENGEFGSECFDERAEGMIQRKTNRQREKEKIFLNKPPNIFNEDDKENIPVHNQIKTFQRMNAGNSSFNSAENFKAKDKAKSTTQTFTGSLHQQPFQVYAKGPYKENKNTNKDNINKFLQQPFTILAPDAENLKANNQKQNNTMKSNSSVNSNFITTNKVVPNSEAKDQAINSMNSSRAISKPSMGVSGLNKSSQNSSKKKKDLIQNKASENNESSKKSLRDGINMKINELSRSGKFANDMMLDSVKSRESVILEVPEEKPKEDAFLEYLKRNILLKNPNIDNYTRALLETPIKLDASQREKLESCLVVRSVLSGDKMLKFVSENFSSNIDEITKKYLQFIEENQINSQLEQSNKYPDLITSKMLQSEEKYDYSYRKNQERGSHHGRDGSKDNLKQENDQRSFGSSDCDERDFDEKNSGESEEDGECAEKDDLAASSNLGGDLDDECIDSSNKKTQAGQQMNAKQQNIFTSYKKAEILAEQERQRILMHDYMEDINEVFEEDDESEEEEIKKKRRQKIDALQSRKNERDDREEECYSEEKRSIIAADDEGDEEAGFEREEEEEGAYEQGENDDDDDQDLDGEGEEEEEQESDDDESFKRGRQLKYEDVEIPNYLKNIVHNKTKSNGISKSESTEIIRISLSNTDSEGSISNSEEMDENKDLLFKRPKDNKNNEMEFLEQMNNNLAGKKEVNRSLFKESSNDETNEKGHLLPNLGHFEVKRNIHIKSGSFGNSEMMMDQHQALLEKSKKRHSFVHEPDTPPEEERRITLVESRYMTEEDPEKTLFNPKLDLFFLRTDDKSEKKLDKSGKLRMSKHVKDGKETEKELDFHEKISQFLTKIREETPLIRVSQTKLFENTINYESFHKHKTRHLFDTQDEINFNKDPQSYKHEPLPMQQKILTTKPMSNKFENKSTKFVENYKEKEDNKLAAEEEQRKKDKPRESNTTHSRKAAYPSASNLNHKKNPTRLSPTSINGTSSNNTSSNNTSAIISSVGNTSIANTSSLTANNSMSGPSNNQQRTRRGNNILSELNSERNPKPNWKTRFSSKESVSGLFDNKSELVRGGSHKVLTSTSQNPVKILNNIKKSNSKSTFEGYKTPAFPQQRNLSESNEKGLLPFSNQTAHEDKKRATPVFEKKLKSDQRNKSKWSVATSSNSIYDEIKKKFEMKDQALSRKHFK